ncbi:hypothetical protein [Streptomyces griseorubiginosus]|uniref:hypothetical protein n=1 Tax=Streptomyces griseorubiginosus TaxID=67304 RepID=UPI00331ADDA2
MRLGGAHDDHNGRTGEVHPYVPDGPRVTFRQGRPRRTGGHPHVRTRARERSYEKVLDTDDQLTPGPFTHDLTGLEADPTAGWSRGGG